MENAELMSRNEIPELGEAEYPSFNFTESEDRKSPLLARHKEWLSMIRHETPNPKIPFKVAVYIRYYNQTKYDNYLEFNKHQFATTLAQYPNWEFVGFYVDHGSTAPNMEKAPASIFILFHGKGKCGTHVLLRFTIQAVFSGQSFPVLSDNGQHL